MTSSDLSADEASLFTLVPKDGSTVGNIAAQRKLKWGDEQYWRVRDALVDRGLLAVGRGRGGTIRRVIDTPQTEVVSVAVAPGVDATAAVAIAEAVIRREEELYEPISSVLKGDWARDRRSNLLSVEVIARQGRRATGGTWSRPDLVSVEVRNLLYYPTKILEVITFEVKPADAIDVQAVYEALAHRRASTRAYVLLHVPDKQAKAYQEAVEAVCAVARTHGVGVVTFSDPADYNTWEERERAERVEPDPERMNQFIETQLPDPVKNRIARDLR